MIARHTEAAFETGIEEHLLAGGYTCLPPEGFDRERAIFPDQVLAFIRDAAQRMGKARILAQKNAAHPHRRRRRRYH